MAGVLFTEGGFAISRAVWLYLYENFEAGHVMWHMAWAASRQLACLQPFGAVAQEEAGLMSFRLPA